ncbi:MAG: PLP-dependent aspartate aminotransferase family protein [Anaerolineae bacterium]|nr:PLP-dependent aspartate aminotransferase family protein [Anaerolineae bacterium]
MTGEILKVEEDSQSPDHCLPRYIGSSTRAVHLGENRRKATHALIDPIFQTSTYTFDNMADARQFEQDHLSAPVSDRFEYGRYGNPTVAAAEKRLAALEHAEGAIQVASGMAAITFTLLSLLPGGAHLVMTDDSYRRTRQFCEEFLPRYNISCSVVPFGDYEALESAIRPETRLLFSETPSNPYMRILDVPRFAEIGRRHGVKTVIDATFSTPINFNPLDYGIDLIIHSATKYLGGHHDLLAGYILGRSELINPLRDSIGILGGISDPHTAYLLIRGLKTLSLRVKQQNQTAQQVAEFLQNHPAVENVWYPGLVTHPDYELGKRLMRGFGGVVSFTVKGDEADAYRVVDALKLPFISPSLGGAESLVIHLATQAYSDLPREERLKLNIPDNLIRLALGVEDAEDLITDLDQALRTGINA